MVEGKERQYIPRPVWLQARALFLIEGLKCSEIAERLNIPNYQVDRMMRNGGWQEIRAANEHRAMRAQDEKAQREAEKVQELVAIQTEGILFKALDVCDRAADRADAKDLMLASSAVKNLHGVGRSARGQDLKTGIQINANSLSLNSFVVQGERVERNIIASAQPVASDLREMAESVI